MSDLVKLLREGTVQRTRRWSGDTHYDLGGTCNEEATEKLMTEAADSITALEAKLRQIYEMGPMTVDDQRWRIARDAISEPQKPSHQAGCESTGSPDAASSGRVP